MQRIFLSHSSKDRDFIETELIPFLRKQGVDPWYSRDDIEAAVHWESTILQGLRESPWFLVVLTPNSVASEWVQTEVSWALSERKGRVIPILLRPCQADELHLALRRIQWVDFTEDPSAGWKTLATLMRKLGGTANRSDPSDPIPVANIAATGMPGPATARPATEEPEGAITGEFQSLLEALLADDPTAPEVADHQLPREAKLKGVDILSVEDEPLVRQCVSMFLTGCGARVESAPDGLDALKLIREQHFDLVILDLRMPRMGGEEFVRIMVEESIDWPIIIHSGYLSPAKNISALSPPIAYCASKPVIFEELLSVITEIISDVGFRAILVRLGLFTSERFALLRQCRATLVAIRRKCSDSSDLFQASLRHKAVDLVRDAVSRLSGRRDFDRTADELQKSLARLEAFWDRLQIGAELGIKGIVDGKTEEIPLEYPSITVTSTVDPRLDALALPSQVETLFVLALLEFVGNALDALSGQGALRITLSRLKTRKSLLLSVWNSGSPIPPELADKIFREGVTSKGPGRGMGLFIIDQLARKLGGTVQLTQGQGVQFSLEMPVSAGPRQTP